MTAASTAAAGPTPAVTPPVALGRAGGFTRRLAEDVAATSFATLSPAIVERALQGVLDYIGVTIAGSTEPGARIGQQLVAEDGSRPTSTVLGTDLRSLQAGAALCNGLAAHSQDFDDSNPWAQGHTSVSVLSAALALAEELGSSGAELLAAYVAGVEVACRIGVATGSGADRHGFHLTGLTGAFGAAAACGRLLGLDVDDLQGALGIAATAASGLKGVFGTQGKHLNAARAAVEGMLAARLVARGFTAPDEAITGPTGYSAGFTDTWDVARIEERMGARSGMEDIVFKFHACCHGTHSTIEGISGLRRERPFGIDEVEHVVLRIPPVLRQICMIDRPVTGLASKFSLQYAAALALAGHDTGPGAFTDEVVAEPVIAGLVGRVELVDGEPTLAARAPTDVLVELTSGERLAVSVSAVDPAPDDQLPGQRTRLEQKFAVLAGPVIGESQAARLAAEVVRMDESPTVAGVLRLAATGRAS